MARTTFRILGCGSSGGVPRLGGLWGDCDPLNPKNRRKRCSLLVTREGADGVTRVLVDTSPDLRQQLLDADVGLLDGVIYTHEHADHVHGIDDLRMIVFNRRERLPVYANAATRASLTERFAYAFVQPEWSSYPPILDLNDLEGPVTISGAGGDLTFTPFTVGHGGIDSLGFRVGDVAYLPDVAEMYPQSWEAVKDLDIWILDALRRTPHPTHAHLERSLEWIARAAPKRAVLTNMHIDLDYQTVCDETPDHIPSKAGVMELVIED
ncbi:MAG: MBL fold metallo-hydrolase [Pseudomonadota bacterium]